MISENFFEKKSSVPFKKLLKIFLKTEILFAKNPSMRHYYIKRQNEGWKL